MIDIDSQIRTSPAECNLAHAQSLEYANKLQGDCGVPQDAMQGEEGATTAGTTDALGSIHWGQCIITDNCSRKQEHLGLCRALVRICVVLFYLLL